MRHVQRGISMTFLVIAILAIAVASAAGYFVFSQNLSDKVKSINSFEECAKHYPVMESYPEQCNTPDGKHFVRELSEAERQKRTPSNMDDSTDMTKYCASYSNSQSAQSVRNCGDFIILRGPCCDQVDIILDKTGNEIARCGGVGGYSEECQKFLPQNKCLETQCHNP